MKLTISILLTTLILTGTAIAQPNSASGMIGKPIPQGFLEYVPFTQDETGCEAVKQNISMHLMVRHYKYPGYASFRSDLFIGFVIIGHWFPFEKVFYQVDSKGVVTGVAEHPEFGEVQHCIEGFTYYLDGIKLDNR